MTRSEAGNADGFSYLPGRFFACAVRARGALYYSHDWVASVLSLAGVDAPAAGAPVLYARAPGGRARDGARRGPGATRSGAPRRRPGGSARAAAPPPPTARARRARRPAPVARLPEKLSALALGDAPAP